jgi:hypothetical protein
MPYNIVRKKDKAVLCVCPSKKSANKMVQAMALEDVDIVSVKERRKRKDEYDA